MVPVLPPSSATVTIVVISIGRCFNPLKTAGMPVPPPITTTLASCVWFTIMRVPFFFQCRDVYDVFANFLQISLHSIPQVLQNDVAPLYSQLRLLIVVYLLFHIAE